MHKFQQYQPYPGSAARQNPPSSLQPGGGQAPYPTHSTPSPQPPYQPPHTPYDQRPTSPYVQAPPSPYAQAPASPYGHPPPSPYTQPPASPYQQNQPYSRAPPPPPPGPPGNTYSYEESRQVPYGQPPQQGQYPPPGGQYGAPPPQPATPQQIQYYEGILINCIRENGLENFYPPGHPAIRQYAERAPAQISQLVARWKIPQEIANDIIKLALFDIVLYIDDSGSMAFEEDGSRIEDLKAILERVAFAATLFDDDGISIRFMNQACDSDPPAAARTIKPDLPTQLLNNIKNNNQIADLMSRKKFTGLTPMGTELRHKVVDGIVGRGRKTKPSLVITITDGQPAGENTNEVFETVKYAVISGAFPKGLIKFGFAQVGKDEKAQQFLGKLDSHPQVGSYVDCTSHHEYEAAEMLKLNPPVELTLHLWLMKLLLGAIDHSYDRKDENTSSSAPPPGTYGAPPQNQYGQQQGYPPQQQGYPPQQQGYPPQQQGYPPQQQGYPSQQQGYPPQQQGYPPQGYQGGPPQGQYPPGQGGYQQQPQGGYGQQQQQRPPQGYPPTGYQGGPPQGRY